MAKESTDEIDKWLATVMGGEVPHYERNERTLSVLRELMKVNIAEDDWARREIETYRREAEVFTKEAKKLSAVLAAGGIAPGQLPADVRRRLEVSGNAAAILDVEDASLTGCVEKLKELQLQKSVLQEKVDTAKKELQRILELTDAMEQKVKEAKQEAPEESKKARESQRQCQKMMRFLISKQQQYESKMKKLEAVKVDPTCTHEEIVARFKDLEQLEKKREELEEQLRPYHDLPPNEEAIASKLRAKKERLQQLEEEFQKKLKETTRPK